MSYIADVPLVTVLICNYNYGQFIDDCIVSALNQTWQNLQVVVVDDGSTDDSRNVIERFGNRIQAIFKENGGQASAFNAGFSVARGDIVCLLDSDDRWKSNKIEEVVKKFQSGPWAIVSDWLEDIDQHGDLLPNSKRDLREGELIDAIKMGGLPWLFAPSSGISIRSDVARQVFPIPEQGWRICADNPVIYAALCHGPMGVIDSTLTQYRYHGANGFFKGESESIKQEIAGFVVRTKTFYFLNDYLLKLGHTPAADLKNAYFFFRLYSFVIAKRPWLNLAKLWRLNLKRYLFDLSNNVIANHSDTLLRRSFNLIRYMFLDAILCVMVPLGLSSRHVDLKKELTIALNKLDARNDYDRRALKYLTRN